MESNSEAAAHLTTVTKTYLSFLQNWLETEDTHNGDAIQSANSENIEKLKNSSAITANRLKLLELIQVGNIESVDLVTGRSPLLSAVAVSDFELAELLIKFGASVNTKDNREKTSLHIASELGDVKIVSLLLSNGAEWNFIDKEGYTALDIASAKGHFEIASLLVESSVKNGHSQPEYATTALHLAAKNGHYKIVELLLKHGTSTEGFGVREVLKVEYEERIPPIQLASRNGHHKVVAVLLKYGASTAMARFDSPLHLAAENGHFSIVKLLLEHGADMESERYYGETPLQLASSMGRRKVVALLIAKGASLEQNGTTALHYAAAFRSGTICKDLIKAGINVNFIDSVGCTPLHCAHYYNTVDVLVSHGGDIHAKHGSGKIPLHEACQFGYNEAVFALLERGSDIHCRDDSGRRPIHRAAEFGNGKTIATLYKRGADIHCRDDLGRTPLHLTSNNSSVEVVDVLLSYGADLHCEDNEGKTPLHLTSIKMLKTLLEKGADIERKDKNGRTPLHIASRDKKDDVVAVLLSNNANIHSRDNEGRTPLHLAAAARDDYDDYAVLSLLLGKGAELNSRDNHGRTPLHLACKNKCYNGVTVLLELGADVHLKDNDGRTPLHLGSQSGCADIVTALLNRGADVASRDNEGTIPLLLASKNIYDQGVISKLLDQGSDIHCRDQFGKNILHYASEFGFHSIVPLIVERGADINVLSNELQTALDVVRISASEAANVYEMDHLVPMVTYLERYVRMMKSVNLYLCSNLLKDLDGIAELDEECCHEMAKLKVTLIGNSEVTYCRFLGKSVDQLVLTLKDPELHKVLNSGSYKTEFPNFGILISNHFLQGSARKELTDKVMSNCSEVFDGLLEECVEKILSFLSNEELLVFADGFACQQ